ncbi:tail assembly chaperone [Mycobacterium phage Naca]|uniref:Tail assembly chaperone n=1 Tax=Mycobacterium phage Naca TaxID=2126816 RepID=A0A2P1N231_9CAUD|nr:tail assembly chaperone [Mycobacterium phage Naca]AVP42058.1 tail assembly chaperone [Mycobacterium phage Naca]
MSPGGRGFLWRAFPSPAPLLLPATNNERSAMSNFSLDNFRTAAKRKYAPVTIELEDGSEVELRGYIRLNEKDREKVFDNLTLMGEMQSDDGVDDMPESDKALLVEAMHDILLVLAPGVSGRRLISEIGGDPLVLAEVLGAWMQESRLGEAVSSPNS